ncbi:trithorax group protein osa-like [Oncorhynchus nerka]|uniref:trithorax group protein osa-like n=1 Tax=Oncorhynchus nerka TaxID=8023 RepID=UPI0031B80438
MLMVSPRLPVDTPRMEPVLSGSLKRRLTATEGAYQGGLRQGQGPGNGPGLGLNGTSYGTSMTQGPGVPAKRLCLEDVTLAMGSSFQQSPYSRGQSSGGHGGPGSQGSLEGNRLGNGNPGLGSPYSMPPKASPGSAGVGGGHFHPNGSSSSAPSVEQELQDILDELTKNPDPSLTELDLDKILGNKEDQNQGHGPGYIHPHSPKRSPQRPTSHLESHLTRSPGFPQAGSPQVGPSPAGAPYSIPHPSKPVPSPLSASPHHSSSSQNQARSPMLSAALSSRPGSTWHEVSRAQQLQQMASNSNKHLSSNTPIQQNQSQNQTQASIPPLSQQGSPWGGQKLSNLPNSSPLHQQPFSPAGSIQSPQGSLSLPSAGPSPPYHPEKLGSPAIAQPPFSPQSTLLPGGTTTTSSTSSNIQGSQANYMPSGVAPTSGATRPSPPYRTDKPHVSPLLQPQPQPQPQNQPQTQHPHPYSTQNGSGPNNNMSSQLYKAMTAGQPCSLKLLMQQQQQQQQQQSNTQQLQTNAQLGQHPSMSKPGSGGTVPHQEPPYSFTNTKPLRHFDPNPDHQGGHQQKMGGGGPPEQGPPNPMAGYRGMQHGGAAGTAASVAANHAHLLQQRMQQMAAMQQATAGALGGPQHCREEQIPGLQDPSVPRSTQTNYNNLLLIRRHLQQEQKRQMEQMTECQQGATFTGGGRPLPPDCVGGGGYPLGVPQLSHGGPLPSGPGHLSLPPGHPGHPGQPGPPGSLTQVGRPGGAFMGGPPGSKQPLYLPSQGGEFVGAGGMPMRQPQLAHGMMGMGGPAGPPRPGMQQQVSRMGMTIGGLGPGSGPGSGSGHPQHLRQALHHSGGGAPLPRMMFTAQQTHQHQQTAMWPPQQQGGLVNSMQHRMPCSDGHMDPSANHQQSHGHIFPGGGGGSNGSCNPNPNAQFTQQALRSGMPGGGGGNNFAPHQGPPSLPSNQGVGVPSLPRRLMQKLGVSTTGQPLPSMVHQGLQPGMRPRGPLSALAGMKPIPPGMIHHPGHGMAPPSYPASGAVVTKHPHQHPHPHGPGYGPGQGNPGHKLPPYEYTQRGQSNGGMGGRPGGGGGGEVDFIDTLVGSNEDWLNNLTMIDEYLEQNS